METPGVIEHQDEPINAGLCMPECDEQLVPRVGRVFKNVAEGEKFYDTYASACGFQTRRSTLVVKDGTVVTRYVLCNRQGSNDKNLEQIMAHNSGNGKKRKTTSTRVECMARVVFQFEAGVGYRISSFNEGHTYPMVNELFRPFMKSNRKVDIVHKIFIHAGIKANVGPIRTFRLYKEISGSYEDIGATAVDFKNYDRDLRAFVDGADAQIIIDNFQFKQESCEGFQYFFDVDEAGKLNRIFWADERSVKNYKLFGDAVSLDATYSTNRYKLIFTPFTGRDNHGGCVTFAAALIFNEDVQSYTWILEKFALCMKDHPKLIITDQDPALKKDVPAVFPDSHHRFCLWHITKKIPDKISPALRVDPDFKTKLDGLIWSELEEPWQFEDKWHSLMNEYGLSGDKWFSDMFDLRSFWIPAYFRDIPMSGLFKTTSLSESENSFFKRYLNKNSDLVRFQMHFNSAMDAQRHSYKLLTLSDETGIPTMLSELYMERHASTVYTNKKFYEVQEEIHAAVLKCVMHSIQSEGVTDIYEIDDGSGGIFKVSYDSDSDFVHCVCKSFIRRGIPCRHMIYVMRTRKHRRIPDKYILKRWSKLSQTSLLERDKYTNSDSDKLLISNQQYFSELCNSIASVNNNIELQEQLLSDLKGLSEKFSKIGLSPEDASSKKNMFELFYGCKLPDRIVVGTPDVASTKGSGASGRIKSYKEKAIEAPKKNLRNCRKCNKLVPHNSRNCTEK